MGNRREHGKIYDELPKEVRAEVNRLLLEPQVTYDDIKVYLDERGYDIGRSSIGRYGKKFMEDYRRLRIIEDKSKALVSETGEGLVLEEAASKIFSQMIIEAQLDGSLDIKELPRIISDFAKLQTSSVNRERLKKEIRNKALAEAAEAVETEAKKQGAGAATIDALRAAIMTELSA